MTFSKTLAKSAFHQLLSDLNRSSWIERQTNERMKSQTTRTVKKKEVDTQGLEKRKEKNADRPLTFKYSSDFRLGRLYASRDVRA